jgi:hypothetical protein
MSRLRGYLCGVSVSKCIAPLVPFGGGDGKKIHGTVEEARKCFIRELKSQGYIALDNQAFRPPNGGPVLTLPRLRKFGQVVVCGKRGEAGIGKGKRLNLPRHQAAIHEVVP